MRERIITNNPDPSVKLMALMIDYFINGRPAVRNGDETELRGIRCPRGG